MKILKVCLEKQKIPINVKTFSGDLLWCLSKVENILSRLSNVSPRCFLESILFQNYFVPVEKYPSMSDNLTWMAWIVAKLTRIYATGFSAVGLSSFKREWAKYCPEIYGTRPMTNLCWVCLRNNTKISRSANLNVEVKAELIAELNQHLMSVTTEMSFYQSCVEDSKRSAEARGTTMLEPYPSCSKPVSDPLQL
ncbi:hypothetical protein RRG08_033150 [Elysia crispata]|uniref:Uncharacterized protein n=1 Tax=Elysia crispata TaxID=231223 RepID=A0AAE0YXU2_9GAST|nr:hypothetical protein RRG08_033150 [Elysia crispata]